MNTSDFLKLKKDIDKLQQLKDRTEGSRDSLLSRLEEFGCSDLDEATVKLDALQKKADRLTKLHEDKLAEFEDKWADKLESLAQ